MILFNALPIALTNMWQDPRTDARYSSIYSYSKMVCYSCGFYRTLYGGASQLRKLGGHVPPSWGESNLVHEDGRKFGELTILSKGDEPLTREDAGKPAHYRLRRAGDAIQVWCNDVLIHDIRDTGQYAYYANPLNGGKLAFRNFSGYIDSFFDNIVVRKISGGN